MKTTLKRSLLAAGVMLLCAAGTAQAGMTTMLKANVPFPFVVNGQTLPAGKYDIERGDLTPVLLIRNENHKQAAFVVTIPNDGHHAGDRPVLTFKHDENKYRLVSVSEGSGGQGWDLIGR